MNDNLAQNLDSFNKVQEMFTFAVKEVEKKQGSTPQEKLISVARCQRSALTEEFYPAAASAESSKLFLEEWKPVLCFDRDIDQLGTYKPSIYGTLNTRHDDNQKLVFEVGPSDSRKFSQADREAELAKMNFIILYNNERIDVSQAGSKMLQKESMVERFKLSTKVK